MNTNKSVGKLNRALLRATMTTDSADTVADRIEELETDKAVMLATLERVAEHFKRHGTPEVQGIACDVFNAIDRVKA